MTRFIYVTYIRTTAAKLWRALTDPETTPRYWFGCSQECDWTVGAPWTLRLNDGRVADSGEVLEVEPEKRLVLAWRHQLRPELHDEGVSHMTWTLEETDGVVKFTVVHEIDKPEAQLIAAVSTGWPAILSSLKSLLETGRPLDRPQL